MKFHAPFDDDRLLHNDGRGWLSNRDSDRIKQTFLQVEPGGVGAELEVDAEFRPTVFPFTLIYIYWHNLFLSSEAVPAFAKCPILSQTKVGVLTLKGFGPFNVYNMRALERLVLEQINFPKSRFQAVKSITVTDPSGPSVVKELDSVKSMAELDAERPSPGALRCWLPQPAVLNAEWKSPLFAFDGEVFISETFDLTDTGLVRTPGEIEVIW